MNRRMMEKYFLDLSIHQQANPYRRSTSSDDDDHMNMDIDRSVLRNYGHAGDNFDRIGNRLANLTEGLALSSDAFRFGWTTNSITARPRYPTPPLFEPFDSNVAPPNYKHHLRLLPQIPPLQFVGDGYDMQRSLNIDVQNRFPSNEARVEFNKFQRGNMKGREGALEFNPKAPNYLEQDVPPTKQQLNTVIQLLVDIKSQGSKQSGGRRRSQEHVQAASHVGFWGPERGSTHDQDWIKSDIYAWGQGAAEAQARLSQRPRNLTDDRVYQLPETLNKFNVKMESERATDIEMQNSQVSEDEDIANGENTSAHALYMAAARAARRGENSRKRSKRYYQ